jgi:hypothetical protein
VQQAPGQFVVTRIAGAGSAAAPAAGHAGH